MLTRDRGWRPTGVLVAHDLDEALALAEDLDGRGRWSPAARRCTPQALPLADEQVLTEVPLEPEGDAFYPAFDERDWVETEREHFDGFERVVVLPEGRAPTAAAGR